MRLVVPLAVVAVSLSLAACGSTTEEKAATGALAGAAVAGPVGAAVGGAAGAVAQKVEEKDGPK
jgi:hypothetical protein